MCVVTYPCPKICKCLLIKMPQIAKFTGPTWAPDGPHVGPMNLAIRGLHCQMSINLDQPVLLFVRHIADITYLGVNWLGWQKYVRCVVTGNLECVWHSLVRWDIYFQLEYSNMYIFSWNIIRCILSFRILYYKIDVFNRILIDKSACYIRSFCTSNLYKWHKLRTHWAFDIGMMPVIRLSLGLSIHPFSHLSHFLGCCTFPDKPLRGLSSDMMGAFIIRLSKDDEMLLMFHWNVTGFCALIDPSSADVETQVSFAMSVLFTARRAPASTGAYLRNQFNFVCNDQSCVFS